MASLPQQYGINGAMYAGLTNSNTPQGPMLYPQQQQIPIQPPQQNHPQPDPRVTLAVPSTDRITKLEKVLGYTFRDKELITRACSRPVVPGITPFPDDRLISVAQESKENLVLWRVMKIGHVMFEAEIERAGVERGGIASLLYPYPQHVLDMNVLPINKAIVGAVTIDGGFEAVAKVMPSFYAANGARMGQGGTDGEVGSPVANMSRKMSTTKVEGAYDLFEGYEEEEDEEDEVDLEEIAIGSGLRRGY